MEFGSAAISGGPKRSRYDAVASGLKDYWYPVTWAGKVTSKPTPVKILDDEIFLVRENGKVYALNDKCPHRGVSLSTGRQEFPGTWACRYHGWVFELATGTLKVVLTDGPDSPACGKVRLRTYPVEERCGLVWIFMGDGTPPPVEADIPEEMLRPDTVILGRITRQKGNWRYGCENAFDEGHYKYLHRYGVLFSFFQEFPAWSAIRIIRQPPGWITRDVRSLTYKDSYNEYGTWPRSKPFWKRSGGRFRLSMRLPGIMRNRQLDVPRTNFSWYVPIGSDHHYYLQFYVAHARGFAALRFRLLFWLYLRWVHFVQFNKQDIEMVEQLKETAPARLYRPDVSIFAWRELCESARQFSTGPGSKDALPEQSIDEPVIENS